MAHREKQTADAPKLKIVRKAIESASEYNIFLNRQRRPNYIDLQTDTVNYPVGLGRENKTLTSTEKIGRFPVAVMPSQYQDWYIEYTPQELQFLPVDTVLKGPIMSIDKLPPVLTTPDVSDFESDDAGSCCSSSDECSSCCSCCIDNNDSNASNNTANNNKTTNSLQNNNNSHHHHRQHESINSTAMQIDDERTTNDHRNSSNNASN